MENLSRETEGPQNKKCKYRASGSVLSPVGPILWIEITQQIWNYIAIFFITKFYPR